MRAYVTLLTVLALLCTLLPVVPPNANAATLPIELSKKVLPVGYAGTQMTVTANTSFPLVRDTKVTIYDLAGKMMPVVENVVVHDSKRLTFSLAPGLREGKYSLMVQSTYVSIIEFSVTTQYDPTNVIITPGADHDIRIDWKDPLGTDIRAIVVQYIQMDTGRLFEDTVLPGVQYVVLKDNLIRDKRYTIKLITQKNDLSRSPGIEFTNGGQGYRAIDTTPPGPITDIRVTARENGFDIRWEDPTDTDLATIAVQYAELGTSNWSDSYVVAKGTKGVNIREMNTAKRYQLRFTKTDTYGNWQYQLDDKKGYGYNFDTQPPTEVTALSVSGQSDNSATLSWTDPIATDSRNTEYHHANVYIRALNQTPEQVWKLVGRADKGVQSYLISGLSANITYQVRVTSVDSFGNESIGTLQSMTLTRTDLGYLTNTSIIRISQEMDGGLEFKWNSDTLSAVDFTKFKVYYAIKGTTDWKETKFSNIKVKSASLRDLPRGTYIFQFRLWDRYGVEQVIGSDFTNNGHGYFVSGYTDIPSEVADVRIQPFNGREMQIAWTAATTNGTHIEIYYAERSATPNWTFHGRVDKRDQRYSIPNLDKNKEYFFKLVVYDANKDTKSVGVVYNNSGFGYNLLGGDRHAPGEVTSAQAAITLNTLAVTYVEPTDPDFDSAIIYAYKLGTTEPVARIPVPRGSNGTTLRELLPGFSYTLKITTIDTYGNESKGVTLTNNSQGYMLTGTAISRVEVRNPLLIPDTNRLIVRFSDPMVPEYHHAIVSIRKVGQVNYTYTQTVNRTAGVTPNEVVFTNLESNQQYQVRIIAVMSNGRESAGLYLGGEKGFNLLPVNNVTNAFVTPGANRLTVAWQNHPSSTLPTAIQVEYQKIGTNVWSEPLILGPYTNEAVISGLPHDYSSYRVRVTHILNHVAASGVILDNGGAGFVPRDAYMVATPAVVHQNSYEWQDVKLLGTNTRFAWSTSTATPSTVKLYGPDGKEVTDGLTNLTITNSNQINLKVKRSLPTGTYTLVLKSREDGELSTTIEIQSTTPAPTLVASSIQSINYPSGQLTMTVTGSSFTPTTKVSIDNGTMLPVTYLNDYTLQVTTPAGLLPGAHKLTVHNDNVSSRPLAFTVQPFTNTLSLTTPTMRTSNYKAELTVTNLDANPRSGKVYLVIRRNGVLMEIKELSHQFYAYEQKKFLFEFGGNNTPYADGPTTNISIQAYVVDGFHQTPVSEPLLYTRELNL